jgi:hypothetical protein
MILANRCDDVPADLGWIIEETLGDALAEGHSRPLCGVG